MSPWIYIVIGIVMVIFAQLWRKKEKSVAVARKLLKRGRDADAEAMLAELTEGGSMEAAMFLAARYVETRRVSDAVRLYESVADKGYVNASVELAGLYLKGEGVERDVGRARELLLPAAEAGDVKSQTALGRLERGEGDAKKARKWLEAAAGAGFAEARRELAELNAER